jgi:hypothetical protein
VLPSGEAMTATVAITSMSESQSSRPVDLSNAFSSHPQTAPETSPKS